MTSHLLKKLTEIHVTIWCHQAPVPLSIFRSNSKFDENSKHSSVKYTRLIITIFCTRHDSATVVTCAKYRCDRSSIFENEAFWIFIEFRIRSNYVLVGRAPGHDEWHLEGYAQPRLTHWPLGDLNVILKMWFSILFFWLLSSDLLMIMPSDECHRTLLMISQHWFRWWLGAVRQQASTWANVDSVPCRLMASLGHNMLICIQC